MQAIEAKLSQDDIERIVASQGCIFGMEFAMRTLISRQNGKVIVFFDGFIDNGMIRSRTRCLGELTDLARMSEADLVLLIRSKMTGIAPRGCARKGCFHLADTQKNAVTIPSPIGSLMVFLCGHCFTEFQVQRRIYASH
jgi:hypothetical protein